MLLFDRKIRTDLSESYHGENIYDCFDRSARTDITVIRRILNTWFRKYPKQEQNELKSRFKKTFSSAFYELFIHELFRTQKFKIEIHPEVPNSTKRPDFLMKKGNVEFYVESKETKNKSDAEAALENKINQLFNSINNIKSPNFFLKIEELKIKTEKQPSVRNFTNFIEKEFNKYKAEQVSQQIKEYGIETKPHFEYEDDNLKLSGSFIPRPETLKTDENYKFIGVYPHEVFVGGSEHYIKKSFIKKANRYGKLDKPFIICINAIGDKFTGKFDVENAIWGSLAFSWTDNPEDKDEKLMRMKDGIFYCEKGSINKKTNGVLVTNIFSFNIANSSYWFAKHPFSTEKLDFEIFDLSYYFVKNGQIKYKNGKSIKEILKIKRYWLLIKKVQLITAVQRTCGGLVV